MYRNKFNIAFLFDKKNNWIKNKLNFNLKTFSKKFNFKFFYYYKKIKNFDIVFIIGYTKILKSNFLEKNKLNLVVHESNLPRGKGFSPVQNQIREGKTRIKINLIKAELKPDSGAICESTWMNIPRYLIYDEIRDIQAKTTKKLIIKFLKKYPLINFLKQKGRSSFYKKLTTKDDMLNTNKSLRQLFNKLRTADNLNFPNYFFIHGKKFYIKIYK